MATEVTDKLFEALPRSAAKVGAGGVTSDSATTIPHTFVGLTDGDCFIVTANRTNAAGTVKNQLSQTETFIGKVSAGNFIECVRGVEGVAQAWGADTVLEILFTASSWNKLLEHLLVQHNQDGTHKSALVTTLKATGAAINTGTNDASIVTPKAIADSNVVSTSKNITNNQSVKQFKSDGATSADILKLDSSNILQLGSAGISGFGLPAAFGLLKSKKGSFTRNMASDTGDYSVTGVGFKPSCIIFLTVGPTDGQQASIGWVDSSGDDDAIRKQDNGAGGDGGWSTNVGKCITCRYGGYFYEGNFKSFDTDGFTITFARGAGSTGTASIFYLALK